MSIFIQHDGPFKRTQKCHNRRRGDKDLQVRPSGVRDLGSSMLKRLGPSGSVDRTVLSVCVCVCKTYFRIWINVYPQYRVQLWLS